MTKRPKLGYHLSDFYCLNCKHKITLPRQNGRMKAKHHLKSIHCIQCRSEVNHLEVRDSDVMTTAQINNAIGICRKRQKVNTM